MFIACFRFSFSSLTRESQSLDALATSSAMSSGKQKRLKLRKKPEMRSALSDDANALAENNQNPSAHK